MTYRYSVDSVHCVPFKLVQDIGRMQGLLDALCACRLVDMGAGDDIEIADDLLNKAMAIAKRIMEETKVSVDDETE